MKTVYIYKEGTGEFLSIYEAHPNPLDGGFIEPTHSTSDPLPVAQDKKHPVRKNGVWELVDDFRGETWYRGRGNAVEITDLGTPKGLTKNEPDATNAELLTGRLNSYDSRLPNDEFIEAIADAITKGVPINANQLRMNGRNKIT